MEEEEEEVGSALATSATRRAAKSPAPFLMKTYELLEKEEEDRRGDGRIVSWNGEGNGFVVWSPEEFSQRVLPRYFKHCNFSSFIRQLNTYGFKKSASDRWEFQHEKFRRGRRDMLVEISRRKCARSIFPSFLPSCTHKADQTRADDHQEYQAADQLLEENKNLQRENSELVSQISHFKALEVQLLGCLSRHLGSGEPSSSNSNNSGDSARLH